MYMNQLDIVKRYLTDRTCDTCKNTSIISENKCLYGGMHKKPKENTCYQWRKDE